MKRHHPQPSATIGAVEHPCFSCTLANCDTDSSGCEMRKIDRAYTRARRAKAITPELSRLRNLAYAALYADKRNDKRRTGTIKQGGLPATPVCALGQDFESQAAAERALGLGRGTLKHWLRHRPDRARLIEVAV